MICSGSCPRARHTSALHLVTRTPPSLPPSLPPSPPFPLSLPPRHRVMSSHCRAVTVEQTKQCRHAHGCSTARACPHCLAHPTQLPFSSPPMDKDVWQVGHDLFLLRVARQSAIAILALVRRCGRPLRLHPKERSSHSKRIPTKPLDELETQSEAQSSSRKGHNL